MKLSSPPLPTVTWDPSVSHQSSSLSFPLSPTVELPRPWLRSAPPELPTLAVLPGLPQAPRALASSARAPELHARRPSLCRAAPGPARAARSSAPSELCPSPLQGLPRRSFSRAVRAPARCASPSSTRVLPGLMPRSDKIQSIHVQRASMMEVQVTGCGSSERRPAATTRRVTDSLRWPSRTAPLLCPLPARASCAQPLTTRCRRSIALVAPRRYRRRRGLRAWQSMWGADLRTEHEMEGTAWN